VIGAVALTLVPSIERYPHFLYEGALENLIDALKAFP
tara:strand:- start:833 stop:943 length:111 start_codon:yes stop_codon:yes gene_type:complete